jgi:hypothetical protein
LPVAGNPRLGFENTAEIAIQRYPQAGVLALGTGGAGANGLWTSSHESNPPRNNYNN